jgi:hypothetical protein
MRASRGASGVGTALIGGLLLTAMAACNHTLRWDTNNPSASRFTLAFPGAVLDKNTGLVWEQAPDTGTDIWGNALQFICANKTIGGTVGWRLPSVIELKSVQDPSLPAPFVPANVFSGIQSATYWSATTSNFSWSQAWGIGFLSLLNTMGHTFKTNPLYVWCVRGPMQESVY